MSTVRGTRDFFRVSGRGTRVILGILLATRVLGEEHPDMLMLMWS
jgi:hypothetical protein